ncbi:hydrocephalus-inducing protein homolog [Cyprinus carpio]|uniref:Hydrocephalus-inducing protein homolog n=1 Tax=Cyprinus carpio TaxID=7962 RepID=A0A9Q9Z363_CYPCA|nr:hydrocephalus-inducing protein homolog [Cyprinus carpio]
MRFTSVLLQYVVVFPLITYQGFIVIELNGNLSQLLSVWLCDQTDKHIPLYLRRQAQLKQQPPPVVFELLPSDGTLYPGDRTNVQVKFSPAEGILLKRISLKGYDAQNVLLPPRAPGETLPPELLDFYKEQSSQKPKQGTVYSNRDSGEGLEDDDKGETAAPSEGDTRWQRPD